MLSAEVLCFDQQLSPMVATTRWQGNGATGSGFWLGVGQVPAQPQLKIKWIIMDRLSSTKNLHATWIHLNTWCQKHQNHQTIQHSTREIKKSRRLCQQPCALASAWLPRFFGQGPMPRKSHGRTDVSFLLFDGAAACIEKLYIVSKGACGPWFINQPGSMLNRCNMIHCGHFSWLDFFHSILKPCRCHAWLHGGSLFDFASQWWSPQMNTNGGLDKVLNIICKAVCRVICGERDFIKYSYHFVHGLWGQRDSLTR